MKQNSDASLDTLRKYVLTQANLDTEENIKKLNAADTKAAFNFIAKKGKDEILAPRANADNQANFSNNGDVILDLHAVA